MNNLYFQIVAFGLPGSMELIIILAIAILIFGKRLPGIARGMGQSLFEFKKGMKEIEDTKVSVENDIKEATELDKNCS